MVRLPVVYVLMSIYAKHCRRYLCKEAPYGGDLSFSEDSLRDMHNADLCDTLGNLVHRATNLCSKYCGGAVPDVPAPVKPPVDMEQIIKDYVSAMEKCELQVGANLAMQGFRDINRYLTEEAPWLKKGDEHAEARQVAVRATLEAIYALTHLLLPFLPSGGSKIFQKLNKPAVALAELKSDCRNLIVGTKIDVGEVLYTKVSGCAFPCLKSLRFSRIHSFSLRKRSRMQRRQPRKKSNCRKKLSAKRKKRKLKPSRLARKASKLLRTNLISQNWTYEWARSQK